jgi:hypothetical protein
MRQVQFYEEDWTGLQNGELLQRAISGGFDVFLTAEQNLTVSAESFPDTPRGVVVV